VCPSSVSSYHFLSSTAPPPTQLSTLSLHDALPISAGHYDRTGAASAGAAGRRQSFLRGRARRHLAARPFAEHHRMVAQQGVDERSEEHTSELQSRRDLVCRLLLEKKKKKKKNKNII